MYKEHNIDDMNLYSKVLSIIDTLILVLNLDGTIYYVNEAFEKVIGIDIRSSKYKNVLECFRENSMQSVIDGFLDAVNDKKTHVIDDFKVYTRCGQELMLKITINYTEIGENSFVILTADNLTREAQLAKVKDIVIRLNNMLSKYYSLDDYFDDILKSLVEVIPYVDLGSILLVDDNNILTMRANVGYNAEMAKDFYLRYEESFFYRCCGENIKSPIIINDLIMYSTEGIADILDNNKEIEVASSLSSPIIIDGKFKGLLNLDSSKNNIFTDEDLEIMKFLMEQISIILTSHQLLNQTIYLSKYDQLTGLYNRWYLNELEKNIIPHSIRYKENFYYVMMDINNLKMVNDKYGHVLGDAYIKEFSFCIKKYSRKTDILIRIGGDEFIGIFYKISKELLIKKLGLVNKELETRMKHMGISESCGFSYGLVSFPEESKKLDELIKIADIRMYEKKKEMKEKML